MVKRLDVGSITARPATTWDFNNNSEGFVKFGSYYYHAYYTIDGKVHVDKMSDIDETGLVNVYLADAAQIRPALTVYGAKMYLGYRTTGFATTCKLYESSDGTNWTLDRTPDGGGGATANGIDIFSLNGGTKVWAYIDFGTKRNFYDFDAAADIAGPNYHTSVGSVDGSKYYWIVEVTASTNYDVYEFNGAAVSKTEDMDSSFDPPNVWQSNYYAKYYRKGGGQVQVASAGTFVGYWDKQKASWVIYSDVGLNCGGAGYIHTDADTCRFVCFADRVYEILEGGLIVCMKTFSSERTSWGAGWDFKVNIDSGYYLKLSYSTCKISYGKVSYSREGVSCNIREQALDWNVSDNIVLTDDSYNTLFRGFVSRIRDEAIELKSMIPTDYNFLKSFTWSAEDTDEMVARCFLQGCMLLHEGTGTIDTTPATNHSFTAKETIFKHLLSAEQLEAYLFYYNPDFVGYFDDGATDTGLSYAFGDGKLLMLIDGSENYAIHKVILTGSGGSQVVRTSTTRFNGQTYRDFFPQFSTTDLQTMADNLIAKNSVDVRLIECFIKDSTIGVIQFGQLIEIAWSPLSIAASDWYIMKVEYDMATGINHIWCSDALVFNLFDDKFKNKITEVAAPMIAAQADVLQTNVDAKVSDVAYAASWDSVTTISPSKNVVYDRLEVVAPFKEVVCALTHPHSVGNDHVMTNGAWEILYWQTETQDDDTMYDAGSKQKITIKTAGKYRISFHSSMSARAGEWYLTIGCNNADPTAAPITYSLSYSNAASASQAMQCDFVRSFSANDYIIVALYNGTGADKDILADYCYFSVQRVA